MQVERQRKNGAHRHGFLAWTSSISVRRIVSALLVAGLCSGMIGCRPAGGVRVRADKLTMEELTAAVGLSPHVMTAEVRVPCHWRLILESVDGGKTNLQHVPLGKSCAKVRLLILVASDPHTTMLKSMSCEFQGFIDGELRTSTKVREELEAGMSLRGSSWNNSLPSPMSFTLQRTNGAQTSIRFVIETNSVPFKEM